MKLRNQFPFQTALKGTKELQDLHLDNIVEKN